MWLYLLLFFAVGAVLCAVGFKKFVWFISIGYGFAVAGLGIAYFVSALVGNMEFSLVTVLQCVLFVIYGARLSGYLLKREIKNARYRESLKEDNRDGGHYGLFLTLIIWISCAALYVAQTSPVFFRLYNGDGGADKLALVGLLISAAGLILEAVADKQKSREKAEKPEMVATKGLYRFVRCPNYLGELIFWTGVFVGGLDSLSGAAEWIIAVAGYIAISYIMYNSAARLDKRQEKHYGKNPEYRAYADRTPIILPLVPLYHIGKYKA